MQILNLRVSVWDDPLIFGRLHCGLVFGALKRLGLDHLGKGLCILSRDG